jgi:hypothetical protein
MPTWLRRRQYLATERNAVRLQQTLRILAETAEIPDEVRAETSARSVAEQHRALRLAAHRAEAVARARDAAATRSMARKSKSVPREPKQKAAAVSAVASARLRRSRALATVVLVASLVGAGFGVPAILTGGTWVVMVLSALGVFASLGFLQRVATVSAARRASAAVDRTISVTPPVQSFTDWQKTEPARPTWTPVPLPKPLYMGRAQARPGLMTNPQVALLAAAAEADHALRAAQASPEVTQLPVKIDTAAASARPGSRYASMGVVGNTGPGMNDLDEVLRRRRKAS